MGAIVAVRRFTHFIDGADAEPAGGRYLSSEDPATGQPWAEIAQGDKTAQSLDGDADQQLAAAQNAADETSEDANEMSVASAVNFDVDDAEDDV